MSSDTDEHADPDAAAAALPAERAFVIQLRAATDGGVPFAGRVEHIASGLAARFASVAELIGFVQQVLAPPAQPAGE
jgi:hypothetical protein